MIKNNTFTHLLGGSNKSSVKTANISVENKLKSLQSKGILEIIEEFNKLRLKLYNPSRRVNKKKREELELEYDIYKYLLENHIMEIPEQNEEYSYYPEFIDPNFNLKILQKKEFNKYITPEINRKGFNLSNAQKFVKNYISEDTPYNGILLWWGVGVGKTCGALSIAENFKKKISKVEKRILILTPSSTLHDTWINEVFNVKKELNKKNNNVQCTKNSYISEFNKINSLYLNDEVKKEKKMKKIIEKYYELLGYYGLVNMINTHSQKYKNRYGEDQAKIHFIKEYFSNRVIIMDEVHVTREESEKKKGSGKLVPPYLELIARYAKNTKIILLTATPFYNDSVEILWLLKLLLINDERSPLFSFEIFNKNKELQENFQDILIRKSRGYISYLRGSHPSIFPIRLQADNIYNYVDKKGNIYWENKKKSLIKQNLVYTPKPDLKVEKDSELLNGTISVTSDALLSEQEKINSMKFINCQMSTYQHEQYLEARLNDQGGLKSRSRETSNIALKDGFPYQENSDGKLIYKRSLLDNKVPLTHITRLRKYSSKFYNLLNIIKNTKGTIFIYSRLIDKGIRTLATILEENGAVRYEGIDNNKSGNVYANNITEKYMSRSEDMFDETYKYIYIDGKTDKKKLTKLIDELNGNGIHRGKKITNMEGEHIKIVLGSGVISQGINMKRIREIHIIDPWYNLSEIEQVIGRGTRSYSHMELIAAKRNITIFLYCATLAQHPINVHDQKQLYLESTDESMYRLAFHKKIKDSLVGRVLKRNSIDCYINKKNNYFDKKDYPEEDIINSRGVVIRNFSKGDVDNSIECEFSKCDYDCIPNINMEELKVNFDTYSSYFSLEEIEEIKEYIAYIFTKKYVVTLTEIEEYIKNTYHNIDNKYIHLALENMIKKKIPIYNSKNREGYIMYRYDTELQTGLYIYQPYDLQDETVPMIYRYYPLVEFPKFYEIKDLPKKKVIGVNKKRRNKKKEKKKNKPKNVLITELELSKFKNMNGEMYKGFDTILAKCKQTFNTKDYQIIKPTINKVLRFSIIDRETPEMKMNLLRYIIQKKILKKPLESWEVDIWEFFSTKIGTSNVYLYFIIDPKKNKKPLIEQIWGFRIFHIPKSKLETDDMEQIIRNRQRVFKINKNKDSLNITFNEINISLLEQSMDLISIWKYNKILLEYFSTDQYEFWGCLEYTITKKVPRALIRKGTLKLLYKIGEKTTISKTGKPDARPKNKLAVCGSGKKRSKRHDLAEHVNNLVKHLLDNNTFTRYNITEGNKKRVSWNNSNINFTFKVGDLCSEIEILLRAIRYRKYIDENYDTNIYWFSTLDERILLLLTKDVVTS